MRMAAAAARLRRGAALAVVGDFGRLLAVSGAGRSDCPFGRGFVGSHRRAASSRQPIVCGRRRAFDPAYQAQADEEDDRQKDGREWSTQKGRARRI
jgi:hypothetical protein